MELYHDTLRLVWCSKRFSGPFILTDISIHAFVPFLYEFGITEMSSLNRMWWKHELELGLICRNIFLPGYLLEVSLSHWWMIWARRIGQMSNAYLEWFSCVNNLGLQPDDFCHSILSVVTCTNKTIPFPIRIFQRLTPLSNSSGLCPRSIPLVRPRG